MQEPTAPAPRGRPPTITRERIAQAGIDMGLPNVTVVGVATALGVSQMALYKHVPSLYELKRVIAEEIFSRWQLPQASGHGRVGLQEHLTAFADAIRVFVKANPGVTPYVLRRLAATPAMLAKIEGQQRHIARAYGLSMDQSRWLLATVAFHGLAAADTVYSIAGHEPMADDARVMEQAEMEAELVQGMHVLVAGALAMLERHAPDATGRA